MKRTMTNLMIAAAMMATAGSASALTTANDRPTLDNKSIADLQPAATHEQAGSIVRDIQKSHSLLPKHPDASGILGCPGCHEDLNYSAIPRLPAGVHVSPKHPDSPVLVANGGGCKNGCLHGMSTGSLSTWQQIQLYISVFSWLS